MQASQTVSPELLNAPGSIRFDCGAGLRLSVTLDKLVVRLRSAFGTSHSSTTVRENALFTVRFSSESVNDFVEGRGETGLPPKKPGCYLADFADCCAFFRVLRDRLLRAGWLDNLRLGTDRARPYGDSQQSAAEHDGPEHFECCFAGISAEYFPFVRPAPARTRSSSEDSSLETTASITLEDEDAVMRRAKLQASHPRYQADTQLVHPRIFRKLLCLLDELVGSDLHPEWRAAKSGLECAFLDAWSKAYRMPFHVFAGFMPANRDALPCSYYTSGLNPDIQAMVDSAHYGGKFTPHLKVKVDSDLERTIRILRRMTFAKSICVDANSAWSPGIAMEFLRRGRDATNPQDKAWWQLVTVIEQPFPLEWTPGEDPAVDEEWRAVYRACSETSVKIYADESIATFQDVACFAPFIHGVNIKIEKTGGIRAAVRSIQAARQCSLGVWIGIMVSSALGTGQAAQLIYLADHGDLDGGLLVYTDRFEGGFEFGPDGRIILKGYGGHVEGWHFDEMGFGVTNVRVPEDIEALQKSA